MDKKKLQWALDIINKIEYSSDGFVKRYPSEREYAEAFAILDDHINPIKSFNS